MKLVALALGAVLATACYAQADPAGPVYAGPPGGGYVEVQQAQQPMPPRARAAQLREGIVAQFDTNGDGRLEPQERRHAIRQLHRIERQLRREQRQERRAARAERRAERQQQRQQPQPPPRVDVDVQY
jgi:hypothetical protein|nr:hypothetical protein [Kofleriaceae bacterium]